MDLKQKKITIIKLIVIMAVTFLFLFVLNNTTLAASISSDIDGIDESKYPGYKERIKQLKSIYPNIQVLYTGLDWNTVIYNEHSETHGRNLVSTSMDDAWVCQECKNAGTTYDSGLYCASEQAIEYMMDPRNSLTQTGIFQFQKLNTSVGTDPNKISLILNMEHVDYLKNDQNVIQAFANVAKNNNLNAYFLISRVIQEQGRVPTSPLATGAGYTGNGYNEYGKGYYNLFSIGATRASGEESYMTRVNALTRAMDEGWDSLAKSIEGGGNFVGSTYIDVGQNTLYLQKFDVYNTNGQLYWHQYMQNLFGAQSEAQILYGLYQITGIQNSKDFVFIVPIYENMPSTPVQEPTSEYYGTINTDLKTMVKGTEADGRNYITGEVLIAEWINGVACTPSTTPEMTIKSTDGTFSAGVNLVHNGGLSYSYYRIIDNLDINKEYYLEATLTSDYNISTNKTQTVNMPELTAGEFKGTTIKTKDNKIYFSVGGYVGAINTDLKEISLNHNEAGRYYLSGNMLVAEWIDGTACIPKSLPELKLKSTDGTISINMYISYLEGLNYYYDVFIDDMDITKQYYIEASLTSEDNIGTSKVQRVLLPEQELGEFKERTIIAEDNLIKPTYVGAINTDLQTMNLALNGSEREYISGEILIAEWINGVANEPQGLPKMILRATDGSYSAEFHLVHNGGLSYSYDRVVYNLKPDKEYEIEVQLTGDNNKGTEKTQIVQLESGEIGKVGTFKLVAEDNKLRVEDGSLYVGAINTDLKTMKIGVNEVGREYISGEIIIAEWVDGVACEPQGLPTMTLKSTDGEYSAGMHVVSNGGLNYSYDRVIYNLDTSKTYYIEVELTGEKNIGENKVQKANLNAESQVGEFKDTILTLENNEMIFKAKESKPEGYIGTINTDLKTMNLELNGSKLEYITGEILIAEWIDEVACEPQGLPKMTLKATDGSYSAEFHLVHNGGLSYTYDRVVYNLKQDKEYEIEVELTGKNNIGTRKTQITKLPNGEIGKVNEFKLVAEDNKLRVEDGSLYVGAINTDLKTMKIGVNEVGREYISGEILIAEWIDGVACEPQGLPKMTLKSTDGTYNSEIHVVSNGGLSYTYDRVIYNLDTTKEYYIEVELTGEKNIGTNKVQRANLNTESEVGTFKDTTRLVLRDNMMIFEPVEIIMLIEEPKVEDKEEVRQEENKVEQEQTEITNKQEEVKDENEEEIPEVIEDEEQENNKQEENEIKEKVTENTNIVENTTNIIETQNIKEDAN